MQDAGFPVHRLGDGAIDLGFYRSEAARVRTEAMQGFWRQCGHWLATQLKPLSARSSALPSILSRVAEGCPFETATWLGRMTCHLSTVFATNFAGRRHAMLTPAEQVMDLIFGRWRSQTLSAGAEWAYSITSTSK